MSHAEKWPAGFDPQSAPVVTHNELRTAVAPEALWPILVRVTDWPSWYVRSADVRPENNETDLAPGSMFRWKTMGVTLRTEVVEFVPFSSLAWIATGSVSRAYHRWDFDIEPGGGCLITTDEVETGIAPRLLATRLKRDLLVAHQEWLEALVHRAGG
jgi:hypothetical protein